MSYHTVTLLDEVVATGAGSAVPCSQMDITYQAATTGAACTVLIQGSVDGGTSWHTILTLSPNANSVADTMSEKWSHIRANCTGWGDAALTVTATY